MTGAPMPDGADAIVMVERTERDGDDGVRDRRSRSSPGDHVRVAPAATSKPATCVFEPGTVLTPAHLGVLASLDVAEVRVSSRARASACSRPATSWSRRGPLAPGKIRDSNRPMLLALLAEAGCEPVDLGIARDDEADVMTRTIADAVDAVRRARSRAARCRSATTTS